MALKPLNDVALVQVERNEYKLNGMELAGGDSKQNIESGIVLELPQKLLYLGFHAFAFESSLADVARLTEVANVYKELIGKRVYWTALSDRGSVLTDNDDTYALIKLTDFIAVSEANEKFHGISDGKMSL